MAQIWDYIAQYNPTGFYEDNRSKTLKNDYMNVQISAANRANEREKKIMDLEDAIANGDKSKLAALGVYEPEKRGKMIDNEEKMVEYARPFAQAYMQASPENKAKVYGQIYGKLKDVMDVSDIPMQWNESVDGMMETLANADPVKIQQERQAQLAEEQAQRNQARDYAKMRYVRQLQEEDLQKQLARIQAGVSAGDISAQEGQNRINALKYGVAEKSALDNLTDIALDPNATEEARANARSLINEYTKSKTVSKNGEALMPAEVREAQNDYVLTGNPESKQVVDRWNATQQSGDHGKTQAGLAIDIVEHPEKYSPESYAWASDYLKKNNPETYYSIEQQKAAGKKVGEREGTKLVENDMGFYRENGQRYVMPGTEAEEKYLAENDKKITNNSEIMRVSNTVVEDIDRAMKLIRSADYDLAGWSGATMSYVPDTAAYDLKVLIDSIKGNAGVDSLLNIKRSGAGLGQIPQSQMDFLSNLMGNLSQAQSLPQLEETLGRYRNIYSDVYANAKSDNDKIFGKIRMPKNQSQASTQGIQIPSDADAWGENGDDWGI